MDFKTFFMKEQSYSLYSGNHIFKFSSFSMIFPHREKYSYGKTWLIMTVRGNESVSTSLHFLPHHYTIYCKAVNINQLNNDNNRHIHKWYK